MNQKAQEYKEISREDRIILAHSYYGWYTFGLAVTESEKIDENCAMDNGGVPVYEHQLTEKHKAVLARHKKRTEDLPVFHQSFVNLAPSGRVGLSDEQADEISRIINMYRAGVREEINNPPEQRWELYSWGSSKDGVQCDSFVISQHATDTAANKALERYAAKLVYADIVLFQTQAAATYAKSLG